MISRTLDTIGSNSADLYVRYLVAAEQAVLRGEFNNAKIFRALAYSHRAVAMNAYRAKVEAVTAKDAFHESIRTKAEIQQIQSVFALDNEQVVTQQSAIAAKSLDALSEHTDVPEWIVPQFLFTCINCGYIVEGKKTEVCPTCGALSTEFQAFGPFYASDAEHLGQLAPESIETILLGTINEVTTLITGVDDTILTTKPSPTEWSIKEIIGHILETDALFLRRIQSILTGSRYEQPVPPWKTHEDKHYNDWSSAELIEHLTTTRQATVIQIQKLTPRDWATAAFMLGENRSVLDNGTWIANHDRGHVQQIKRQLNITLS